MNNPAPFLRLLDPEALAKVRPFEFVARGVMEGVVSGRHRSPARGFSVEFAEHRPYTPGDNVRDLDWRVLGKSDRYSIKQYVEETNLRCTVLLDASGSMSYTGERALLRHGLQLSKFEYARLLATTFMHLLLHQQDAIGLATFDSAVRRYFPARARATHFQLLLEELYHTRPGQDTALAPVIHEIAERIPRRSLVVLISDLFDEPEALLKALHHFRFRKHEVILFHVMAEEESMFPFTGWSEFDCLEKSGLRIELNPRALRSAYLNELHGFLSQIKKGCGEMGIDYVPFSTHDDFGVILANWLARRSRR